MFNDYEEIERAFEITVADNGYVLKLSAEQAGVEDSWATDYSFVFGNLEQLTTAIDALTEVV